MHSASLFYDVRDQVQLVADPLAAARDSQLSIFSHNKRQVLALQVLPPIPLVPFSSLCALDYRAHVTN
jgi:hypothetical protein